VGWGWDVRVQRSGLEWICSNQCKNPAAQCNKEEHSASLGDPPPGTLGHINPPPTLSDTVGQYFNSILCFSTNQAFKIFFVWCLFKVHGIFTNIYIHHSFMSLRFSCGFIFIPAKVLPFKCPLVKVCGWYNLSCLSEISGWFFFFLRCWDLNSWPTPWATPPALFCDVFFQDRVLQTFCLGWLRTSILLVSASWVARITGKSHWHPALAEFLFSLFLVASVNWT
jgi:hypothetical protein